MTPQRGSKFQNSELLPSEKKNWTKFITVPDFNIFTASRAWYTNLSLFEPIFRWRLKWRWFYKGIIHLIVPFTFVFHLSITISTWDTSSGLLTSQFCVNDFTTFSQNLKILRERFHKRIIYLKVPFTFDFHLSINIGTWNTNLDIFDPFLGWWRHHRESKLQKFEKVVSKPNNNE